MRIPLVSDTRREGGRYAPTGVQPPLQQRDVSHLSSVPCLIWLSNSRPPFQWRPLCTHDPIGSTWKIFVGLHAWLKASTASSKWGGGQQLKCLFATPCLQGASVRLVFLTRGLSVCHGGRGREIIPRWSSKSHLAFYMVRTRKQSLLVADQTQTPLLRHQGCTLQPT